MRAIIHNPDRFDAPMEWCEVRDPEPAAGEVLVEVHATALNRADLMQRAGQRPHARASEILGLEMAGRVRRVGPDVQGWRPGDRVCALLPGGGYAELAVVPAAMLMRVPDTLTLAAAAGVPEVFLTAYSALFWEGRLQTAETVLIHAAASGVGTAAIQLAHRAGAHVVATAGGPRKVAACIELGARLAVDRHTEDFAEATRSAFGGVDLILDMVGAAYFERNIDLLNKLGRLVFVAAQSGHRFPIDVYDLTFKRLSLIGTTLRSRPTEEKVRLTQAFEKRFGADLASGAIRPIIDRVLPVQQADAAHAAMAANENVGKIVLTMPVAAAGD